MHIDSSDVMVFIGAVVMIVGLYLIVPAWALVGLGVLVFMLGVVGALRRK